MNQRTGDAHDDVFQQYIFGNKCRPYLGCHICFLMILFSFCEGTVIIPSRPWDINNDQIKEYDSMIAGFGAQLEMDRNYRSNLYLPPHAMNEANRISIYHFFCEPPIPTSTQGLNHQGKLRKLYTLSNEKVRTLTGKEDPVSSDEAISVVEYGNIRRSLQSDERKQQLNSVPTRAILVKRGNCSFEKKARIAMKYNEKYVQNIKSQGMNETSIDKSKLIEFLLVYDNEPQQNSRLIEMTGSENTDDVNIKLLFLTTRSGNELNYLLHQQYYNTNTSNGDSSVSKNGLPIIINAQRLGDNALNNDKFGDDNYVRERRQATSWLRFVLCILLILFPAIRTLLIWYSAGGRIRMRNENGRISFYYVPPHPMWLAHAVGIQTGQVESTEVPNKMNEDEVFALPEIVYGSENSRRDETENRNVYTEQFESKETPSISPMGQIKNNTSNAASPISDNTNINLCTSCSICLDDFENGEKLRLLPCGHFFHTACILPWLTERQGCCPLCKAGVNEDNSATSRLEESTPSGRTENNNDNNDDSILNSGVVTSSSSTQNNNDNSDNSRFNSGVVTSSSSTPPPRERNNSSNIVQYAIAL